MTDEASETSSGENTGGSKMGGCLKVALGAAGAVVVLGVIGAMLGDGKGASPSIATATAEADAALSVDAQPEEPGPEANDPGISAAEFAALQSGMSQADAEAVVGSAGEVISESDMAGFRTVMVQWEGESGFGANANAMFQNGKLISKAQFGLE